MRDLTTVTGNPTSRIQDHYQHLMGIGCVETLKAEATRVVDAGGISEKNLQKFRRVLATKNSVNDVRFYLTNYLLAGAGLSTGNRN